MPPEVSNNIIFMGHWVENYFVTILLSALMTGLIIPKILLIAFRKKLFDSIDERKIHRGIVPRLGGMSFLPSIIFSFFLVVGVNVTVGAEPMKSELDLAIVPLFFLICGEMLLFLVGIADDLIGVRYRAKFIFQILSGVLIAFSGVYIFDLYGFLWIHQLPHWIGWLLTIFLVLFVVNAVNLIDGIDGLASGLSVMGLAWYSFVLWGSEQFAGMLLAGATIGALGPFFYFNVFGRAERHRKIFMGDTGSLTIGMILVFICLVVMCGTGGTVSKTHNIFILAISPILLPCLDVVRVFFHRIRNGRNPFLPDKSHIHHKLLAIGLRQWQALILILGFDALFILLNYVLAAFVQPTWIIFGDIVIWSLLNIVLTGCIRARERRDGNVLYE